MGLGRHICQPCPSSHSYPIHEDLFADGATPLFRKTLFVLTVFDLYFVLYAGFDEYIARRHVARAKAGPKC
jgi:hypothetical protein